MFMFHVSCIMYIVYPYSSIRAIFYKFHHLNRTVIHTEFYLKILMRVLKKVWRFFLAIYINGFFLPLISNVYVCVCVFFLIFTFHKHYLQFFFFLLSAGNDAAILLHSQNITIIVAIMYVFLSLPTVFLR